MTPDHWAIGHFWRTYRYIVPSGYDISICSHLVCNVAVCIQLQYNKCNNTIAQP